MESPLISKYEAESPLISKNGALTIKEANVEEEEDMEEEEDPRLSTNWAEAPWPPVWEAIENSPQYKFGMIQRFLDRWPMENSPDRHRTVVSFLEQVRRSRPHGKCYELVEVKKLVESAKHRVRLITFTVKEVEVGAPVDVVETIQAMVFFLGGPNNYRLVEWRFKPPDVDVDVDVESP